ncbi:MAG: prepilin-type N-terminal cleavage/methylation domain-containing protein [Actinomycetota bacterium]
MERRRDITCWRAEEGFSLAELSVVLVVLGVLLVVAVSAFQGAARAAQISAARQRVMIAFRAESALKVSTGLYLGTATEERRALLRTEEPGLDWGSMSESNHEDVVVRVGRITVAGMLHRQSWVCVETVSEAGARVAVANLSVGPNAGTYYGEGTARLCRSPRVFTAWPERSWS